MSRGGAGTTQGLEEAGSEQAGEAAAAHAGSE